MLKPKTNILFHERYVALLSIKEIIDFNKAKVWFTDTQHENPINIVTYDPSLKAQENDETIETVIEIKDSDAGYFGYIEGRELFSYYKNKTDTTSSIAAEINSQIQNVSKANASIALKGDTSLEVVSTVDGSEGNGIVISFVEPSEDGPLKVVSHSERELVLSCKMENGIIYYPTVENMVRLDVGDFKAEFKYSGALTRELNEAPSYLILSGGQDSEYNTIVDGNKITIETYLGVDITFSNNIEILPDSTVIYDPRSINKRYMKKALEVLDSGKTFKIDTRYIDIPLSPETRINIQLMNNDTVVAEMFDIEISIGIPNKVKGIINKINKDLLRLSNFIETNVFLLRRQEGKTFCSVCYDYELRGPTDSKCPVCNGTGFQDSDIYRRVEIPVFSPQKQQSINQLPQGDSTSEIRNFVTTTWAEIGSKDLLFFSSDRRLYKVVNTNPSFLSGYIVSQGLQCLDVSGDIAYKNIYPIMSDIFTIKK